MPLSEILDCRNALARARCALCAPRRVIELMATAPGWRRACSSRRVTSAPDTALGCCGSDLRATGEATTTFKKPGVVSPGAIKAKGAREAFVYDRCVDP